MESLILILVLKIMLSAVAGVVSLSVKELTVCEYKSDIVTCQGGANIIIKKALYGHLGMGKCIDINTGLFGCKTSVLNELDRKCSGKQTCEISELDPTIRNKNPCGRGLDVFLEIEYLCIAAEAVQPCQPVMATSNMHYISSKQALYNNCKSYSHRGGTEFHIKSKKGQKIKLSSLTLASSEGHNVTRQVGYILDEIRNTVSPLEINVKRGGIVPLMVTESSEVTVSISTSQENYFLLLFTATGCEDLPKPKGMWIERHGDQTIVGCENSGLERNWNLECSGVHWTGVIGNCTEAFGPNMEAVVLQSSKELALPKDIIFVTIVGITVVIALIIVTVGYVCYKRSIENLEPLDQPNKSNIAYNNLHPAKLPALPEKRGSILMRNQPNSAVVVGSQLNSVPDDSLMWEPPAPLPPPRREPRDTGATSLEAVPLRSGDMILDNGNETILVRGHIP